jgi:hypothetical protein
MTNSLLQATDKSMDSLLSWGVGGVILAVFVAPTFWLMVKSAQKREEDRSKREDEDAKLNAARVDKLIDALAKSVEQQKAALDQWRLFEAQEEKVHSALLAGLSQITTSLQAQQAAVANTAATQSETTRLLGDVAQQIQQLKRSA